MFQVFIFLTRLVHKYTDQGVIVFVSSYCAVLTHLICQGCDGFYVYTLEFFNSFTSTVLRLGYQSPVVLSAAVQLTLNCICIDHTAKVLIYYSSRSCICSVCFFWPSEYISLFAFYFVQVKVCDLKQQCRPQSEPAVQRAPEFRFAIRYCGHTSQILVSPEQKVAAGFEAQPDSGKVEVSEH